MIHSIPNHLEIFSADLVPNSRKCHPKSDSEASGFKVTVMLGSLSLMKVGPGAGGLRTKCWKEQSLVFLEHLTSDRHGTKPVRYFLRQIRITTYHFLFCLETRSPYQAGLILIMQPILDSNL